MFRLIISLLFITIFSAGVMSQKYDYQWVTGKGDLKDQRFGISLIDFHNNIVEVNYYGSSDAYALGFRGSFINNTEGKLVLHTNNCDVRDSNWNVLSGDNLLTPSGEGADGCFGPGSRAYSGSHNCIIVPNLVEDSVYYIVHKDTDIDFELEEVKGDSMWVSTVKGIDGRYEYLGKEKINAPGEKMLSGKITACPNKAKDAWWVLIPLLNTNTFTKYLIKNDTIIKLPNQKIGIEFISEEFGGIGQAQYSPDGSMLGMNTEKHGLLLYDFNNETGELSNFRQIPYPNSENLAEGLCFSPDSRFVYLTTGEHAYQVDLENENEIYHIGQYRSRDATGWPVGLGKIFAGPDCRLYVSPGTTTYFLHVIPEPNKKAAACRFTERAIELPTIVPFDLPNLPQYRYLNGCDSNIVFPFEVDVDEEALNHNAIHLFPNPASQSITISLSEVSLRTQYMYIVNSIGQVMESISVDNSMNVDISNYPPGMYFLKDRSGVLKTKKFIVMK